MKNKKEPEEYVLRIYNNPEVDPIDVINAFKAAGCTTMQAEQCALIINLKGKYDFIQGNVYELDSLRVMFQNQYGIISETFPVKENKLSNQYKTSKVMEQDLTNGTELNSVRLFNEMKEFWTEFEASHLDYAATGKKKSAAKSRKAIQSLKAIITDYKKASVEECKM